jgi:RimJ/RimL family protein N-acetyltransferase
VKSANYLITPAVLADFHPSRNQIDESMEKDLKNWTGCTRPQKAIMGGRYVRLEPLNAAHHGDGLFAAVKQGDGPSRFRYLAEEAPESREAFAHWLAMAENSNDPLYFAVIDQATGRVGGRQTYLRIDSANGVIEIGHILWSKIVAGRAAATEAFYLFARHVFDELGYRRFEWKCNDRNEASKSAALRFGMTHEGVFRQAAVVKGRNRDTAWFSIVDGEWPGIRSAMENWLDPKNFDPQGQQIRRLGSFY